MMYSVYGLVDPRDGSVFYVGYTSNPNQRLKSHRGCSRHNPVYGRKVAIREAGLQIEIKILGEYHSASEAMWNERRFIVSMDGLVNSSSARYHGTISYLFFPEGFIPTAEDFAKHDAMLGKGAGEGQIHPSPAH